MECRRCRGLMVRTYLTDWLGEAEDLVCWGWRCVSCGEIIDRQILLNRARQTMLIGLTCWPMADPGDNSEPAEIPVHHGDTPP